MEWAEVINNPLLQDLPFKIELNKWGKILMAPEICVEVVSSSNSKKEMDEKITLYLNQGAKEVWLCSQKGKISYYSQAGRLNESAVS